MSIMEVILTRGPGKYECKRQVDLYPSVYFDDASASFDWPAHVGPANVFYSHVQLQHPNRTFECIKSGLDMHGESIAAAIGGVLIRLWLDMFCLRQCVNDWDLDKVGVRLGLGQAGCQRLDRTLTPRRTSSLMTLAARMGMPSPAIESCARTPSAAWPSLPRLTHARTHAPLLRLPSPGPARPR